MGKAICYTLNPGTDRLSSERWRPANSLVENAIRPFVVGRKNWLFSGHPRWAVASVFLYSLIETAEAIGLKPYLYMRYLFDQLPLATTEDDYRSLRPPYMDSSRLNSAAA